MPSRRVPALLGVAGLILMSAGLSLVVQGSASADTTKIHKSYVCKYVGKPGKAERLQTGQNPIWVDNDSLPGFVKGSLAYVGETFADGQGKSVVIVANTPRLNPEPTVADCPGVVTPDVQFTDSACVNGIASDPSWVGTNTADIAYTITSGSVASGSTVTITAMPTSGFAFLADATNVFTHTFGPAATGCGDVQPTVVTPDVTFVDSVCGEGVATSPSWSGADTADIDYAVTDGAVGDGSAVTITATPKSGFAFAPSTTSTFSHTFGPEATNCGGVHATAVTSSAARFEDPTCPTDIVAVDLGGSGFLSPAQWKAKGDALDTGEITYTITGAFVPEGTVNVSATADSGFVLTPGSASQWTHTFTGSLTCSKATPIVIPSVIHAGVPMVGATPMGGNSARYAWGSGLAGMGAALFLSGLVAGRRRSTS